MLLFHGLCGFLLAAYCQNRIQDDRIQDVVGRVTLSKPAGGKDPSKNNPTAMKTYIHLRANINSIPRATGSADQGDCITESHNSPTIEVHNTKFGSQNRSI